MMLIFQTLPLVAQAVWDVATYPDENGFISRMAPTLTRLSGEPFGVKTRAESICPDTGLPVYTWAVEGETIFSPYTGRAYRQGPTGYFGPKGRDSLGRIASFGGDPLKQDLPPATATLLLDPRNDFARAYLSIPASMRQQYHFACKNWARFYPLLAGAMGPEWRTDFHRYVSDYREARRPSDGPHREHNSMSHPHDLIGQPGELLGGNTVDGGTENHKTMWRTSALVYAQLFPPDARISGYSTDSTRLLVIPMIRNYLRGILMTGNGEYDSSIYYPHSIEAFLNLYDYSTDPALREMAKFALDYYLVTYGLKAVDGFVAGGQKRGHLPGTVAGEMESMMQGYFSTGSRPSVEYEYSLHQATTDYRPNSVIMNIVGGGTTKPFSARMNRPFYHMDRARAFQESFYRSASFGLGNVYMSIVDNPNQQMVWSLVATGPNGPLGFTGGQQYAQSLTGHSPYTQTVHDRGTLLLLTADSQTTDEEVAEFRIASNRVNPWHLPDSAQAPEYELANRRRYADRPLQRVIISKDITPDFLLSLYGDKNYSAASWLWIPREADHRWRGDHLLIEAGTTRIGVRPLGEERTIVTSRDLPDKVPEELLKLAGMLESHDLLVVTGKISGYVLEAAETTDYGSEEAFYTALANTVLDTSQLISRLLLGYTSLSGRSIDFQYRPHRLKASGAIDGAPLDYENWADGAVYQSPYLTVGDGKMQLTDGSSGYSVDFRGDIPQYVPLPE